MGVVRFSGALPEDSRAEAGIIGIPFDGTTVHRQGAYSGPEAIRKGSQFLESYSPFLDRDLKNMDFVDYGDLDVKDTTVEVMITKVTDKVRELLSKNMRVVLLGGERTCSLGAIKEFASVNPGLKVLHLDAHADLYEEHNGEKVTHSTVIRRLLEYIPSESIYRIGVRSGSRKDLVASGLKLPLGFDGGVHDVEAALNSLPRQSDIYLTLDLDVFDPSLVPGVGNPEPMGMTYREFVQLVRGLTFHNLIGFDVVELTPEYDPSGISAIVAASAVRDLMICMM